MNFQTINASASPEVSMNENWETIDFASVYGKRQPVTTGLTWGYYGGRWGGFAVTQGTLSLTNTTNNYVVVLRSSGAISTSTTTTNWDNTTLYARVYKLTTAGSLVTVVEDHRAGLYGVHGDAASLSLGANSWTGLQTFAAGITLSGTASNLAIGSNFISNGGTDAGLSFDGSNNATFSAGLTANTFASSGATLTGGTVNAMVVGGVTPAAGSFTTLSTTGIVEFGNAVVMSGGTVPSVALLSIGASTFGSATAGDIVIQNSKALRSVNGATSDTIRLIFADSGNNINLPGNVIADGTITLQNLAGTGSRAVIADANGLLSSPVSDEHLKENIRTIPYGLKTVMQLKPIIFNFKDKRSFGNQDYIGFSARETKLIIPEITGQDINGHYYLTDEKITAVLVRAIQEQQEQIDQLLLYITA